MPELRWFTSSFSETGGNNCIEIAKTNDGAALRESEAPDLVLTGDLVSLNALVVSIKKGRFADLCLG